MRRRQRERRRRNDRTRRRERTRQRKKGALRRLQPEKSALWAVHHVAASVSHLLAPPWFYKWGAELLP